MGLSMALGLILEFFLNKIRDTVTNITLDILSYTLLPRKKSSILVSKSVNFRYFFPNSIHFLVQMTDNLKQLFQAN